MRTKSIAANLFHDRRRFVCGEVESQPIIALPKSRVVVKSAPVGSKILPVEIIPDPHRDGVRLMSYETNLRMADNGQPIITYEGTNESEDRYGSVIAMSGWKTDSYMKSAVMPGTGEPGGVVMAFHQYDALPVGRCFKLDMQKKRMVFHVRFAIEHYEFAAVVYRIIKDGFMSGCSVGFIPLQGEEYESQTVTGWFAENTRYIEQELLELSVTPIGANRTALANMLAKRTVSDNEVKHFNLDRVFGRVEKPYVIKSVDSSPYIPVIAPAYIVRSVAADSSCVCCSTEALRCGCKTKQADNSCVCDVDCGGCITQNCGGSNAQKSIAEATTADKGRAAMKECACCSNDKMNCGCASKDLTGMGVCSCTAACTKCVAKDCSGMVMASASEPVRAATMECACCADGTMNCGCSSKDKSGSGTCSCTSACQTCSGEGCKGMVMSVSNAGRDASTMECACCANDSMNCGCSSKDKASGSCSCTSDCQTCAGEGCKGMVMSVSNDAGRASAMECACCKNDKMNCGCASKDKTGAGSCSCTAACKKCVAKDCVGMVMASAVGPHLFMVGMSGEAARAYVFDMLMKLVVEGHLTAGDSRKLVAACRAGAVLSSANAAHLESAAAGINTVLEAHYTAANASSTAGGSGPDVSFETKNPGTETKITNSLGPDVFDRVMKLVVDGYLTPVQSRTILASTRSGAVLSGSNLVHLESAANHVDAVLKAHKAAASSNVGGSDGGSASGAKQTETDMSSTLSVPSMVLDRVMGLVVDGHITAAESRLVIAVLRAGMVLSASNYAHLESAIGHVSAILKAHNAAASATTGGSDGGYADDTKQTATDMKATLSLGSDVLTRVMQLVSEGRISAADSRQIYASLRAGAVLSSKNAMNLESAASHIGAVLEAHDVAAKASSDAGGTSPDISSDPKQTATDIKVTNAFDLGSLADNIVQGFGQRAGSGTRSTTEAPASIAATSTIPETRVAPVSALAGTPDYLDLIFRRQ